MRFHDICKFYLSEEKLVGTYIDNHAVYLNPTADELFRISRETETGEYGCRAIFIPASEKLYAVSNEVLHGSLARNLVKSGLIESDSLSVGILVDMSGDESEVWTDARENMYPTINKLLHRRRSAKINEGARNLRSRMLSEGGTRDLETYRQWVGSTPISRNDRKYDGRVLKDDDLVRVWRSVPKGKHSEEALHLHPGMWVTAHTEYLDGYAGRDWQEKTEWRTYEIPAHELVDAQTGEIDGDTLIFIPEEPK